MTANEDQEKRGLHSHCESCIKITKCTKKPVDGLSCSITECGKNCGATFHTCKKSEHLLLCPNVEVHCINSVYGCPHVMLRKHTGSHLESCPASAVPCQAEWNRWPLCSKERQIHIPFAQINPQLKREQLDVALALRDQMVLNHWMTLPRKTQKLMRCALTPRHPSIPLVPSLWNPLTYKKKATHSVSSDDGGLPSAESTPRQSAERSDASLLSGTSTDDESPWGRRRKPPGLLQSVCAQLFNRAQLPQFAQPSLSSRLDTAEVCVDMSKIAEQEEDDTLSDVSNELDDSVGGDGAFVPPGELSPEAPPTLPLFTTMGLDLSIECVPRYMAKPKSMYTFTCAHNFRRDEYAWHYRNWHSEIHGGLDGWIEQRCPLARYGCSYAKRRMHPDRGRRVIYSTIVQSFGVVERPPSEPASPAGPCANDADAPAPPLIGDLPFELLQTIASYLDSFSLCHFAVTSRLFRDVARSLLHSRGLVMAEWEKTRQGWQNTHFSWAFSKAFSPVDRWAFDDGEHMSNHLRNCRYYIKSDHALPERIALPGYPPKTAAHNPSEE